jgi:transposase
MPYKAKEPRRHKIPRARYKVENWAEYDEALVRRGSLTVWVTPEAIAAWTPARTGRRGRPQTYSDVAVEAGLMLRLAFGWPWRQTEGLLGLELPVLDHTTLSRRSVDLRVATALKRTAGPVQIVIDSTGLKVFRAGEWHLEKHGGKPRRTWRKLHLAVDPDIGEILASELTTAEEGNPSLVAPLLDQIDRPVSEVFADGAYDGEPVYRSVADHTPDAAVIIPPRSTAAPSPAADSDPTQRDRHLQIIKERGRLGWQRAVGYGRRSLGEVAMFRYKKLIGRSLHAQGLPAQKTEAKVACKVVNIMIGFGMPVSRRVA